jgi:hypothetical protein
MTKLNNSDDHEIADPEIEEMLNTLAETPVRDTASAKVGRAQFLAEARKLSPVSKRTDWRHTGWYQNFFERILTYMQPRSKLSLLVAAVVVAVLALFVVSNVNTVSAQQILDRASAAQAAGQTAPGISHLRIESYDNPKGLEGEGVGTTTVNDIYTDSANGYLRSVVRDADGKIIDASAYNGTFSYTMKRSPMGQTDGLTIERLPTDPSTVRKPVPVDPEDTAQTLFDQFRRNIHVVLEGKELWTDGSQVYVLVDRSFQTQQSNGTTEQTYTGSTKMVFNALTYNLVESETSIRKNDKDVVLNRVKFLVDEVLPAETPVMWNLSDLTQLTFVDVTPVPEVDLVPQPLTQTELTTHTKSYILNPLPEGYTVEITAMPNQPSDQPYAYEINYSNAAGESFGLQAIGTLDDGFVDTNFYDGSYKSAAGLVLHYSSSKSAAQDGTAAILTTPDNDINFLVISSLPRAQVEALIETLVSIP